eukprot:COSAG02_NODE_46528_length_348_cov_0.726908_1_plen_57_part_01
MGRCHRLYLQTEMASAVLSCRRAIARALQPTATIAHGITGMPATRGEEVRVSAYLNG